MNQQSPNHRPAIEWTVFAVLILAGAAVRYAFRDIPNFAPVAAIALFAGYYFRNVWLAASVPLAIMTITDALIGTYDWKMMVLVYGMLAFPVALRTPLRHWFRLSGRPASATLLAACGLIGCSLFMSVLFYLVTNFGCWMWYDMYDASWPGLVNCYARALPFFRFTLLGDLGFASSLFTMHAAGCYAAANLRSRQTGMATD